MGILKDTLLAETRRPAVVTDCAKLVDAEVAAKKGVTGLMIKGGYAAFKAVKPGIVTKAVEHLLDDFTVILDRHYDTYLADNPGRSPAFDEWARRRDSQIANDLLGVTDDIMARSDKKAIKKIYSGMRNVAQRNVAEAVPAVGRLVIKHLA
jgi:hypothetical protein